MRALVLPRFIILLLVAIAPLVLSAQRVRWEPSGGSLALRQTSQLSLIFEDAEPQGDIPLPEVPELTFGAPSRGEQSSVNIVNGQVNRTRTVYVTYPVRPNQEATIRIPAFTVSTDQGELEVPEAVFEVGEATVGGSSVPLDSVASSRVTVGAGPLWAGEVVPVQYVLSVASRFPASLATAPEWDSAPLIREEWSKPESGSTLVNGENRSTVSYQARGYIREPGSYTLPPVTQLVNLRVPGSGFSIFQAFQAEQYTITSNAPQLVVRPLPAPAPDTFTGAVGTFQLTSKVVPEQATVGEPVTWTLSLSGTGNWPDIAGLPAREVSRDFRVVQPQPQRTNAEGQLFEASLSEDVVLIPTRPGTYELGPVSWSYFHPARGRYETITLPAVTLTVVPDPAATPPPATTPTDAAPRPEEPVDAARPAAPTVPPPPDAIPRDPLTEKNPAPAPWTARRLGWLHVWVFLPVPLLWLTLAVRQAQQADPALPARQARRRLQRLLAEFPQAPAEKQRALLELWRADTVRLWQLHQEVPGDQAFARDAQWQQLWIESERALYSRDGGLPSDWHARAGDALARHRVPRLRLRSIARPHHFLPLLVLAGFIAVPDAPAQAHAPALEAYSRGDFTTAEAQWRQAVAAQPTDWVAHHNLALALAQQEQWPQAAAHATLAFVQHPSHPSVRWHFAFTAQQAGFTPGALVRFINPEGIDALASQRSPATWQRLLVGASTLLMVAIVIALLRRYGVLPPWSGRLSLAAVVAAVLLALVSAVSLTRYGIAGHPAAVLVWNQTTLRSLPTDAPVEQQTATLPAGSLAVVDDTFLGWHRLVFANEQTGWVRQEDVLPLWSAQ